MSSNAGLKKGIIAVLGANLINMIFNLFINFAQPKFLSVDTYAAIKTFQLYVSYAGIIHLGYVDGMYLKYGGKNLKTIEIDDLSKDLSTLRVFQIAVTIVCILLSFVLRDTVFFMVSLSVLPFNMGSYFKSLYQATGEFSRYGRIMNAYTISGFLLNFILILVIKSDSYVLYLTLYLISYFVIWIVLEVKIGKRMQLSVKRIVSFDFGRLNENVKNGFFLMIGNFSSTILTSIDRWFIKALMDNAAFAMYSFAVSMENFLNIAITPLTVTLYNYFCTHKSRESIIKVRNYVTVFAVLLPAAAFPAIFILEHFLEQYLPSVFSMLCLFGAQTFYIIIKSIYVNLYKARKQQGIYMRKLTLIIIIGVLLNILCYFIFRIKEAFAIATLLTSMIWLLISYNDFKEIKYSFTQYMHLFLSVGCLIICGCYLNSIQGLLMYLAVVLGITFFTYKSVVKDICGILMNKWRKIRK